MKILKILTLAVAPLLSVALFTTMQAVQQPSFHTKGTPTGKPTGRSSPASIGGNRSSRRAVRSWCS